MCHSLTLVNFKNVFKKNLQFFLKCVKIFDFECVAPYRSQMGRMCCSRCSQMSAAPNERINDGRNARTHGCSVLLGFACTVRPCVRCAATKSPYACFACCIAPVVAVVVASVTNFERSFGLLCQASIKKTSKNACDKQSLEVSEVPGGFEPP